MGSSQIRGSACDIRKSVLQKGKMGGLECKGGS